MSSEKAASGLLFLVTAIVIHLKISVILLLMAPEVSNDTETEKMDIFNRGEILRRGFVT